MKRRDFKDDFKDVNVFNDLIWQWRLFQTDSAVYEKDMTERVCVCRWKTENRSIRRRA